MRVFGTVNIEALRDNILRARQYAPYAKHMAVVKSNGYGHGAVRVAKALESCVQGFAVATIEEGVQLRRAGVAQAICVLSGFFDPVQLEDVFEHDLDVVVYCDTQIEMLQSGRFDGPANVWVKINSGMNRLGFAPAQVESAILRLEKIRQVGEIRIMSHFARADERESDASARQLEVFLRCTEHIELARSIANSAAIISLPESHLDWVRPGIMIYGASPFADESASDLKLRPAMNIYSTLIAINQVGTGEAVGYGGDWVSRGDARVGIVACGYGDGYPRSASPGGSVLIHGSRARLVGRISMDTFAISLSDQPQAEVGTRVKLFGDGLPVEEVAYHSGTIAYEILTSVSPRSILLETQTHTP